MARSVYQTANNGNGNIYKLVIDHKNKTIQRGYYISLEIGLKASRPIIAAIADDLLKAGYKEIEG